MSNAFYIQLAGETTTPAILGPFATEEAARHEYKLISKQSHWDVDQNLILWVDETGFMRADWVEDDKE